MIKPLHKLTGSLLLALVLALPGTAQAMVQSRIDKPVLEQGDVLHYVLELEDADADQIDLSPLEQDFTIVNRSRQSSTRIINGRISSSVQLVLALSPKRTGDLTLPALTIAGEQTQAHAIKVQKLDLPEAAAGGLEVFSTLSNQKPYVQQPVVYQFTLLLGRQLKGGIEPPGITQGKALVEPFGTRKEYDQVLKGQQVKVLEQSWLITPQESGPISISPAKVIGQLPVGGRSRDLLGGFMLGGQNYKRIELAGEGYQIEAAPVPAAYQGAHWLPAVSANLSEQLSSQTGTVGEPLTRTLRLEVAGVGQNQLPALTLPNAPGIKQYPGELQRSQRLQKEQLLSEWEQEITLIPAKAGTLTLPEIRLPWWDVTTGKMAYAHLPAVTLDIAPAPAGSIVTTPAAPVQETPVQVDVQPAQMSKTQPDPLPTAQPVSSAGIAWYWLVGAVLIGMLAGMLLSIWWFKYRTAARVEQPAKADEALDLKTLQAACFSNDPQRARTALLSWARVRYPGCQTLNQLAANAPAELQLAIAELNRQYANTRQTSWQGAVLWQAIQVAEAELQKQPGDEPASPLAPLYKSA